MELVHLSIERDLPDAGEGVCCIGAAMRGPGFCTCWERKYDQEQAPAQAGPRQCQPRMCADCAFRPDSPEKAGDERYAHADTAGLEQVLEGTFLCHQGMRRMVREVHPSGVTVEAMPDAYEPGVSHVQADGRPALVCAGWMTEMRLRGLLP